QAGRGVDAVLDQLTPLLAPDDAVMDGGNSFYRDTERRFDSLGAAGIHYLGTGISGGESGALWGPSIMPGGPEAAYRRFEPILTKIAAQVDDGPCVTYVGRRSAGHFVKMVHNGIEYGDMQLIAEAYAILSAAGYTPATLAGIFGEWNRGELASYLIEITAAILAVRDADTGRPLVDAILDAAGQKGTGRWTSQEALELGVPLPTIDAAVWSRNISALKTERVHAARMLNGAPPGRIAPAPGFVDAVRDALYAAKICSYAQGMALLQSASSAHDYGLVLAELARIWKGGCIIRAELLGRIQRAFAADPGLTNLLLDPEIRVRLAATTTAWREVVATAKRAGVPCPALSASLDYYDAYHTARLPANLVQAQRDYFGAHTYQRVDRPGDFHTEWERGIQTGEARSDAASPASQ
ncbi:MAG: NADP-dependent phosphogluconate dehydrogenase, partial [Actinobacteria bacterium]|nr:NADP-dependent phosphogluconate dehydrogenase [Actinomycetota bacterium]